MFTDIITLHSFPLMSINFSANYNCSWKIVYPITSPHFADQFLFYLISCSIKVKAQGLPHYFTGFSIHISLSLKALHGRKTRSALQFSLCFGRSDGFVGFPRTLLRIKCKPFQSEFEPSSLCLIFNNHEDSSCWIDKYCQRYDIHITHIKDLIFSI